MVQVIVIYIRMHNVYAVVLAREISICPVIHSVCIQF